MGRSLSRSPDRNESSREKKKKKREKEKRPEDHNRSKKDRHGDRSHHREDDEIDEPLAESSRHGHRERHSSHRSRQKSSSRSPERSSKRARNGEESGRSEARRSEKEHSNEAHATISSEDTQKKKREEEQASLDAQMEERRRRVEEWRKKRMLEQGLPQETITIAAQEASTDDVKEELMNAEDNAEDKKWTLENDEDDDLEAADETTEVKLEAVEMKAEDDAAPHIAVSPLSVTKVEADEDVDPLDAFMMSNSEQLLTENKVQENEEVDPLDAFMNAQVLPQAGASVAAVVVKQERAPGTGMGHSMNGNLPSAASGRKGLQGRSRAYKGAGGRRAHSSDESSSDSEEEESAEEDDAEWVRLVNAGKLSKGDKLSAVDHSQMNYVSFRKNFYIEVPELLKLSDEEVLQLRKDMDGIKVRGKNIPKPIRTWTQAGLSGKLLEILKKSTFERPLPIQAQALPIIMSGRDCIGIAKTGSGKTLAFVLPMMRHIKDQPVLEQGDGPVGLLMAPTRELVQQISKEIKKFAKPLGMNCVAVFGGSGVANQITELKRGTEVVVCTPGRMIDLLVTSNGKITNLRRVTYLVLDEADRMFDMGFEPQIMRIVQNIRPDRQTVLFSATFPRQVETLARKILMEPVEIQVGGRSVVNSDIEQIVEIRPEEDRFPRLLEILGEWYEKGKILVFVQSQEKCDTLFRDLLKYGYPCLSLHGGKDQSDRECTVSDFKSDVGSILVATSVAARGLDVKDLVLVLNYDAPNHHEDYVHRVGRTGRAGNKGTAITFIAVDEERYAPDLVKALKDSGAPIPDDLMEMANAFNEKRKQGLVQGHGSGYGGSGFKFDGAEQDLYKQARKAQAKELGLGGDEEEDEDDGIRRVEGSGVSTSTISKPGDATIAGATISAEAMAAMVKAAAAQSAASASLSNPATSQASLAAQAVAARLMAGVGLGISTLPTPPAPAMNAAMLQAMQSIPGVTLVPGVTAVPAPNSSTGTAAMQAAAQRAASLAASLTGSASGRDPTKPHFEAELEINDFPQHSRWKVTHRETIVSVAELTGAAVITKGVFVPPGRNAPDGERKIYLLIEGPTENSVKRAKQELKRILEETTEKVMRRDAPAAGKYSVV